jgi:UDP-N-acetylmuramate dehydrogenase
MSGFEDALVDALGTKRVVRHAPLRDLTTFRVGGTAEWLIEPRNSEEIVTALALAQRAEVPVTLLGGGSNVLVADGGVRGLVIRPRGGAIVRVGDHVVRADAPVTVNGLVRWTILNGAAGLEAWAGTPGTVGGAVYGNAHFNGRSIGELIESVQLASRAGAVSRVAAGDMRFGYDRSRLQETGEVLLSADFRVGRGDPATLRSLARQSLAFRKRSQPLHVPSAGCIFQNPDPARDRVPDGIPWSAGALIDRAGLKGAREGGAMVSTAHANFIVNDGSASAADIRRLIERCRDAVRRRYGVHLRDEIVYLGDFSL